MGHMDVISFISDGFNIYFPMLILLLCVATLRNWGGHILHFFGFEQFIGDTDLTSELIEDGKNLVGREMRRRELDNERADPEAVTRRSEAASRLRNYSSQAARASSDDRKSSLDTV
jgi:hypothetical protein